MQRQPHGNRSGGAEAERAIGWRGSALDDVRAFPDEARREAGYQLHLLQQGDAPDDWKPMPMVGPGTIEVRIHIGTEHRVFVVSKFEEAIYVLHAFDKTSQRTAKHDLDLARRRYRDLLAERRQR
jgi:phage-related protein